jgi:hypothetical protein
MRRVRVPRALASVLIAAVATAMLAAPVAAVEPIDLRNDPATGDSAVPGRPPRLIAPSTPPAPRTEAPRRTSPTPRATPSPTPTPEPVDPAVGYDVSYPQCGDRLPEAFGFAVVGVNGGRVHSTNPCLVTSGEERGHLEWAGPEAQLYANTANPGPRDSRYWPVGQDVPRACQPPGLLRSSDTVECAYVYGWNAAADSYEAAVDAFVELGWADAGADELPWATTWWLDVETANSWRLDWRMNVASLEGARDYLVSRDVAEVGFYSTPRMWWRITGGTETFAEHPAWHAGATDAADARERCLDEDGFTGGELRMVQWIEDGLDHNLRCDEAEAAD